MGAKTSALKYHADENAGFVSARFVATTPHLPSNTYASRDEAVAVVRALRKGSMKLTH